MKELTEVAKMIVNNLHLSLVFKTISEYQKKDAFEIRDELGLASYSEISTNPFDLLETVKRHILTRAFQDKEKVEFLMTVQSWAGFKPNRAYLETGDQAILAGKRSALAILWVMILPKIAVSPTILPSDIEKQGLVTLVESILLSDESRAELNQVVSLEMINRGFIEEYFDINGIESGFAIDDSMRRSRLRAMLALMLMKGSDFPFDLDEVFNLPEHRLIEETALYIMTKQAMASLSYQISGSGSSRPFDWPLVGTARVFSRLMLTLDVLRKFASKMTTCSLFKSVAQGSHRVWTEWEFTSYLIKEITDYYASLLRERPSKGKNEELDAFVDILKGENIEITTSIMESDDKALTIYEELSDCKRRAQIGEKPQISPERRFRVVLSNLKQQLKEARSYALAADELVEEIVDAFDAIAELIEKHIDSLGSEVDKFTEEICFETSFRILEILNLGASLNNLPWVSRFIAEEVARTSIARGDIESLEEQHRMKRIVSAFAGGVAYLVLQAQRKDLE
ncbi:MAG: hypothetical protein ACFFCT_12780 [Candidatus Odinarchaeota archaeon]